MVAGYVRVLRGPNGTYRHIGKCQSTLDNRMDLNKSKLRTNYACSPVYRYVQYTMSRAANSMAGPSKRLPLAVAFDRRLLSTALVDCEDMFMQAMRNAGAHLTFKPPDPTFKPSGPAFKPSGLALQI